MPSLYVFTFTVYLILALGIGTQFFFTRNRTLGLVFLALLVYAGCIPTLFLALNLFPSGLILFPLALIISTGLMLRALNHELAFSASFLVRFLSVLIATAVLVIALYHTGPLVAIQLSLVVSGGYLLVSTLIYWVNYSSNGVPGSRGLAVNISLWAMAKIILGIGLQVILINPGVTSSIAVGLDGLLGFSIAMSLIRMLSLRIRQQEAQRVQEFTQTISLISTASMADKFTTLLEDICQSLNREDHYQLVTLEINNDDEETMAYCARSMNGLERYQAAEIVSEQRIIYHHEGIEEPLYLRKKDLWLMKVTQQYLPRVGGAAMIEVIYDGRSQGVLSLYKEDSSWTHLEQVMVQAYASLTSILVNNYRTTNRLHESISSMVATLSMAVDARDNYTANHSHQVALMVDYLAEEMNFPGQDKETFYTAALLHDIGKIGVPDQALLKPEPLTEHEYKIIKQHPLIGSNILGMAAQVFSEVIPVVAGHHERWDGQGYPNGLAGEAIPMGSRLLAVADALDAMVSDRVYRPGISLKHAVREICDQSTLQFDPSVVSSLLSVIEKRPQLMDSWVQTGRGYNRTWTGKSPDHQPGL
ncbi:MAG: HD domain-containing phosphohydrolase [Methylocystaceae bacterium]